jgi:hypothetical protein
MADDPVQRLCLIEFGANALCENPHAQNGREKRSEEHDKQAIPHCPPPAPYGRQDDREADAPIDDGGSNRHALKVQISFGYAEGNQ